MKTTKILAILVLALGLILCSAKVSKAPPVLMGSAFTYQGHLYDANDVANGEYDFEFKLYKKSLGGSLFQVGSAIDVNEVDVIDGYFTVELDFNSPDAFNGNALWLEIGVRPGDMNDPNVYTALSPWQEVTPTPYALYAASTGAVPVPLNLSGTSPVITGTHSGSGSYGTLGNDGIGVFGSSSSGNGVHGSSSSGKGVYGVSSSGTGGYFKSISGYGLVVETGNVGIGTTSPSEALDVNGTVEATAFVGDGSGLTNLPAGGDNLGNHIATQNIELNGNWLSGDGGNEGIFVNSAGNVGIGTTNPTARLRVQTSDAATPYAGFFWDLNNSGVDSGIQAFATGAGGTTHYGGYFGASGATTNYGIYVASGDSYFSEDVGIGTTSPSAKLDVEVSSGGAATIGSSLNSATGDYAIATGYDANASGYFSTAIGGWTTASGLYSTAMGRDIEAQGDYSVAIALNDQSGEVVSQANTMAIMGGNVGIGTTSPVGKLTVNENVSGVGPMAPGIMIGNPSGSGQTTLIQGKDSGNYLALSWLVNPSRGSLNTSAGKPLVLQRYEGNVGIGTVSPQGKLDVNGSIYQRGGVLHADYVFEPAYELESIDEHSEFMWQNKHLSAIPKAEVDDSGQQIVEVGAHRKGIVEELEKAHIYIEQLHKQNKALAARLVKLEVIVARLNVSQKGGIK